MAAASKYREDEGVDMVGSRCGGREGEEEGSCSWGGREEGEEEGGVGDEVLDGEMWDLIWAACAWSRARAGV